MDGPLGCLEWVPHTAASLIGGIPRSGHSTFLPTCQMFFTAVTFPTPDHIPYRYPGLEVPSRPCSGLPPRSLLSHPGHQRSQFPPLNGTEEYSLSILPLGLLQPARLVHSRLLALCLEWASLGMHCDCSHGWFTLTHSTLALFSCTRVGRAS